MSKIKVSEIREKFPMYADLPDDQLISGIRQKYYSDIPIAQFTKSIDYDTQRAALNPTKDQSFGTNLLQGVGSGMTSVARALGGGRLANAVGLPGTKEEAERLDAPLMDTAGGKVGQVVGVAAPAALAIPFTPATIGGATIAGGLTGAALTEGDVGDRLVGGLGGAAGGAIGGALPYVYQTGKGLLRGLSEPLTAAGRERIAGRAIERFATNPSSLQQLTNDPTITGARLTLAEATRDPGLATLQRAIGTLDPEAAVLLGARHEANNAARLDALASLTGQSTSAPSKVGALNRIMNSQATRDAAEGARSSAANASYGAARREGVDQGMAEALQPQIAQLMERPEIQRAARVAQEYAKSEGIVLQDMGSVQGLSYLKRALDDEIGSLPPKATTAKRLYTQSSSDLKSVLEDIAPALRTADREFQFNSVPVNRAAVGERLTEAASGAIRDFSGNRRLQANALARALNDEEKLLRQGTGYNGFSALDELLTPTQSGRVGAVRSELETLANLNSAANGPGSQTAKMLASQNLLKQAAGPMGIPDSWIESVLAQTALRPLQFGYKSAESRIGEAVSRGLLDPAQASQLVQLARGYDAIKAPTALQQLLKRSAPAMIGASSGQAAGQ